MNKNIIIPILWFVALVTLLYAVYRSTALRMTVMENGRQVVYGEPQHGLILGLCIFAGICIASATALLFLKQTVTPIEPPPMGKRLL